MVHSLEFTMRVVRPSLIALAAAMVAGHALAQQVVKPPQSQAWIDVATYGGMGGMGGMGGGAGAPNPMAMLGGLFGGGGGKNSFGNTQVGQAGRWVDVTLMTRANPQLQEAQQAVPAGFLSPALKLQAPRETKGTLPPEHGEDRNEEPRYEKPEGRIYLYWGCGDTVRAGQPKVLDMATATPADLAKFFQVRSATQRGTHQATGRPVWPSPADSRMVPPQASLVGEHAFSGQGVPEAFRFQVGAQQDLMPAIELAQRNADGAWALTWTPPPTARAQFLAGMGARGKNEMVLWTSAEVPETGFGLFDYQTNAAVDRWLKEKVLLSPTTSQCTVPKGVFSGEGGMLRAIAYGSELNLAHPPRPTDPRQAWEPQWAVKLRVKSQSTAMLGMEGGMPTRGMPAEQAPTPQEEGNKLPNAKDLLKGIFGR
ncbi:hypothetical protein KAK07_14775 [Ideonella sp. 4Y16]|uniref:hypothetical protein n=1 Tax=Ideonella alba TaxID=2824118 RepID=UPI001B38F7C2|nr:hypothetical protein [Ideonella alba]MBQ0944600.1 hypothetical protein [Ideonella alba]